MIDVSSYLFNPILTPDSRHIWENKAAFNGSVARFDGRYVMAYRAIGNDQRISTIGLATSSNLHSFTNRRQIIFPEYEWEQFGCEDPRICQFGDDYYIFYTAISAYPPGPNSIKVAVAKTRDFVNFEKHLVTPFNAKAMALFPKIIDGRMVAILTVNTDLPPAKIALAYFKSDADIWSPDFWQDWYRQLDSHVINLTRITSDHIEVGAVPVEIDDGWLLIYSYALNYFNGSYGTFGIEAVLLEKENPHLILGKTIKPLMVPQEKYEMEGMVPRVIFPSGAIVDSGLLHIYYGAADTYCALATVDLSGLLLLLKKNRKRVPKLTRFMGNPIMTSRPGYEWESRAVFNPAAILIDNDIHLIYRAMSLANVSVLGHARSINGLSLVEQSSSPVYVPRESFEKNPMVNGFAGCEDPRLTRIGDTIYMLYTAYDGSSPPKIALTSISVSDFVHKNWNFTIPKIISDPSSDNKDGCLFSERINGQYVFLHREGGKGIMIDYVDNLDFKDNFLGGEACFIIGQNHWENLKMGIASPPIKTDRGWLLLYHGVGSLDQNYRVGAMLLSLENPEIVIGRTNYPLLEPEMDYEKVGEVPNVVFPCGAVIKDDELFVYYGGADKVIGVAVGSVSAIIDSLIPHPK